MKQTTKQKSTTPNAKAFITLSADIPEIPQYKEELNKSKGYVSYGADNKYPDFLWGQYLRSSVLQAICNGTCDFVCGRGFAISDLLASYKNEPNKVGDTLEDVIRKCCLDYMIFGGFAVNPSFDKDGNLVEVYWLDFKSVRLNDEDGMPTKAYISRDWTKSSIKPIERDVFNGKNRKGSPVFYYQGHITRGIYPVPMYVGSLAAIETGASIQNFHLHNIKNNLLSGAIVNFPNGVPTDEVKKEIERGLKRAFAGDGNAGALFLNFCANKDLAVTISKLQDDNFDKKFDQLEKSTIKNTFIAFRATPVLFGLNPENNGFSKTEFLEAFELYNETMVKPIQRDLQRAFDRCFNVKDSITFVPFKLGNDE